MFPTSLRNCYVSEEMELAEMFCALSVLLTVSYKKYCCH